MAILARRFHSGLSGLRAVGPKVARAATDHLDVMWLKNKARLLHLARLVYYALRPREAVLWQLRLAGRRFVSFFARPRGTDFGPAHRYFVGAPAETDDLGVDRPSVPPAFDPVKRPMVSIIVPVYNKIDFTLRCLWSIRRQVWRHRYEVIIVDDYSIDRTRELLAQAPGLRLVVNPSNLGFVRSCNEGARHARGDYLLFLNNDTLVLSGWMDKLVDSFATVPEAGLVGSKLLYPDGRLQEAGGFVAQEGSGGNYGRNDDPNKPQYNFLREVDYCSGASIMVPRALFDELGGFDERYAPAYYEDTDLAFTVRKAGRKVLYQPLSQLIHYEGVTSGTDLRTGVKAYQVENKRKFYERWQRALAGHGWPGTDHRQEAERYVGKRVFVANASVSVPNPEVERTLALFLAQLFQSRSYQATFALRRDLSYVEHTIPALERTGVECLYAPYVTSLVRHLRRRGSHYDAVFQYRANSTDAFLDPALLHRLCPKAQLLTHTGDWNSLQQRENDILKGLAAG